MRSAAAATLLSAAKSDLVAFTCLTFPGWRAANHLLRLAEALERVERGETKRLIITMPPRHGKSELSSVRFPAWFLGRNPDKRFILISYAADLAHAHSRQVRNIVQDPVYKAAFPNVTLAGDSRSADAWDIAGHRGGMKATGVGGPLTGHGAHLLLIDDPLKNREEADSALRRQNLWDWYTSTAYTRLEEGGAVVIVHTRWHEDDLTGRLLAAQGMDPASDRWDLVTMPALSDDGVALWPEKYSAADCRRIRATVGPRDWEAIYQGRPAPPEGAMFKRAWFQVRDRVPQDLETVRCWDLAASSSQTADYTVGARCGMDSQGNFWVLDIYRARQEWPATERDMAGIAATEPYERWGVERAGFQLAVIQQMRRSSRFAQIAISEIPADRDKVARARPWQTRAEAGQLFLLRAPWNMELISECCAFPAAAHDDQVDAVGMAYWMLTGGFAPVVDSLVGDPRGGGSILG